MLGLPAPHSLKPIIRTIAGLYDGDTCVIANTGRSEDDLQESVLSFHHVGPGD